LANTGFFPEKTQAHLGELVFTTESKDPQLIWPEWKITSRQLEINLVSSGFLF
jgi:hypothetical protein